MMLRGLHSRARRRSTLKQALSLIVAATLVPAYCRFSCSNSFALPAQLSERRRTSRTVALAASASPGFDGSTQRTLGKRTKKRAVAFSRAVPEFSSNSGLGRSIAVAGRGLLQAAGIAAGLLALLSVTSVFARLSHSTSDLLSGQSSMAAALIGIAVGTLHTVAGPDHLASLAPMVIGRKRSLLGNFGLGALWGSGHASGQLIIGIACLLVKVGLLQFAWAEAIGQLSGWLVGFSLIGIGVLGLKEVGEYEKEIAQETHAHSHQHGHVGGSGKRRRYFGWATYATGVLHGLSPDAIVFIIPALALPRWAAVSHVGGVVLGTLVAMGGVTACLGAVCRRAPRVNRISTGASGVAMLLGVTILLTELGFPLPLPPFLEG
mmetsp:Transcript_13525/g.31822  ORF Transcript_13525/g.31822 Transcript_13525/m.31822 type:complete len:377 (-) Transcript_13525:146-1276(-)